MPSPPFPENEMNNQAAQTTSSVDAFMAKWEWLILSRCRDEFLADLAALAQTAGVASERIAPVQGYTPGIPWSMHLEAYDVYCKRYGKQPELIDLEGRNCRGGFGTNELDMFIPGWRDRLSEFNAMKARIAELESMLAAAPAASGGEDDPYAFSESRREHEAACRDRMNTSGVFKADPPAGVSVSERASTNRDEISSKLKSLIDRYWELAYAEGREGRTHDTDNGDAQECRYEIEKHIRALEQALTQQHALSSPGREGDRTAASTQGLRELVQRWRDDSVRQYEQHRRQNGYEVDFSYQARSETLDTCADELDALINDTSKAAVHE